MFIHLPNSVYREDLTSSGLPIALIKISHGVVPVSFMEAEVAKFIPGHPGWKWEAIPHGTSAFLVSFPSFEYFHHMAQFEFRGQSHGVMLSFSERKTKDTPSYVGLETVWVHVYGVLHSLRHFLGIWALGSIIGSTQDVDLLALRQRGLIRIQVAVHNIDTFTSKDESMTADAFVKLNGYSFTFDLEKDDLHLIRN